MRNAPFRRSTLRRDGAFRQWTNGDLHARLEPTETGHRLRSSTRKGEGPVLLRLGAAAFALSTMMAAAMPVAPGWATIGLTAFSGVVGLAGLSVLALRLPRWARVRAAQMEQIGVRFAALTEQRSLPAHPSAGARDAVGDASPVLAATGRDGLT
ncbi:MAG: hypothetical protein IT361_06600 [Gemmatimonadaceae bacterium]|nr:hypothetical protein [Gemmatimonadaceae bacterium]